jgi:membrane associated rhomboid family serine protease
MLFPALMCLKSPLGAKQRDIGNGKMNHSEDNSHFHNLEPLNTLPLRTSSSFLVYVLLVMIFMGFILFSSQWDFWAFGNYRPGVESGQVWRFFTSMFLHVDWPHLLFNSISLLIFGVKVERNYGHWKFIVIYVFSGLFGGLFSFAFGNAQISVGASGAIFGLMGANLVFFYEYRDRLGEFGKDNLGYTIGVLISNIIYGLVQPRINNWSHMGGLFSGMLLACGMLPNYQMARTRQLRVYLANIPQVYIHVTSLIMAMTILLFGARAAGARVFSANSSNIVKEEEEEIIQSAPLLEHVTLEKKHVELVHYVSGPKPDCIGVHASVYVRHRKNIPPRHGRWLIVPDPEAETDTNIWVWKNHETHQYEYGEDLSLVLNVETRQDENGEPYWLGLTLEDNRGSVDFDAIYNQTGFDGIFIRVSALDDLDASEAYADVFAKCRLDELKNSNQYR